jgi:hypothetical protein
VERIALKKAAAALAVALAVAGLWYFGRSAPVEKPRSYPSARVEVRPGDAYRRRASNVQVQGEGVVLKTLPDDNEGSRHQRFILQLGDGQTVLISHNIELAPRLSSLRAGETVAFAGEYEWNERGGVVHWTHHDPAGRHPPGWLRRDGKTYE